MSSSAVTGSKKYNKCLLGFVTVIMSLMVIISIKEPERLRISKSMKVSYMILQLDYFQFKLNNQKTSEATPVCELPSSQR